MNKFLTLKLRWEISVILLLAFYVVLFGPALFDYKNDFMGGYLDAVEQIRPLDDTLQGKIPFKDFYFQYGPLYSYIQLPAYLLLGQNHNALFTIWTSFLPFLGIVLSYIWAAVFFQSSFYRVFFVILCIFQNVNCYYASLRHLAAEMAIAMFVVFLRNNTKIKYIFLTGSLCGLAILTSQEYGAACVLAIAITLLFLYFMAPDKQRFRRLSYFFLGISSTLGPFLIFLVFNGALIVFFKFSSGYVKNIANPASGEFFPTLPVLSYGNLFIFLRSAYDFVISQNLRFYLPLLTYALAFVYFIKCGIIKKEKRALEIFILGSYGLFIYYRVLSGPVYGYMAYGLIPAITLGLFFVQFVQRSAFRRKSIALWLFLPAIYGWIFLTNENKGILHVFANLNMAKRVAAYTSDKVFYDRLGYFISPKAAEQYKAINEYIETHTDPHEYIWVYPWGPYNHFTKRPSPTTARDIYDFMAGDFVINKTIQQLESRKPRYLILNTFNNGGIVSIAAKRWDVGDSAGWGTEDSPSFIGKGDKVQTYILENYQLEKKFDYASILIRRTEPKFFERRFYVVGSLDTLIPDNGYAAVGLIPLKKNKQFKIDSKKAVLEYRFSSPVECSHAEIVLKIRCPLLKKLFSKNMVSVYVKNNDTNIASSTFFYDLQSYNKPQITWLGFSEGKALPVTSVKIEIFTPSPYLAGQVIEINKIKLLLESGSPLTISPGFPGADAKISLEEISTKEEQPPEPTETSEIETKIIGSTFKTLAKIFVTISNITEIKKYNLKILQKMNDAKFAKKYNKTYEFLEDLPDDVKALFGITRTMSRQEAIAKTQALNKTIMYEWIDAVPNDFITRKFKGYVAGNQQVRQSENTENKNIDGQIKNLWKEVTAGAIKNEAGNNP